MNKDKKVLKQIIESWESLPVDLPSRQQVEDWRQNRMKPAIDKAREQVKPKKGAVKKQSTGGLSIMLDIETLGTDPNSIILEIGAVQFNPETGETEKEFCMSPTIESCLDAGLSLDESTFFWWMEQNDAAREALIKKRRNPLKECLERLAIFIQKTHAMNPRESVQVDIWANPPHFDIAKLEEAYQAVGVDWGWNHRWIRCCRTIWNHPLLEGEKFSAERTGPKHSTISDCLAQIEKLLWAEERRKDHADHRYYQQRKFDLLPTLIPDVLKRHSQNWMHGDTTEEKGLDEAKNPTAMPRVQPPKVTREVTVYKEDMPANAWYHLLYEADLIKTEISDPSMRNLMDPSFVTEQLTEEELIRWNSREVTLYSITEGEK